MLFATARKIGRDSQAVELASKASHQPNLERQRRPNHQELTSELVDALGGSETPPGRAFGGGFQTLKTATVEIAVLGIVGLLDSTES